MVQGHSQRCLPACRCRDCANAGLHEDLRLHAIEVAKRRNPAAFAPKFAGIPAGPALVRPVNINGCVCKRSRCQKKYCECFRNRVACTTKCQCVDCENTAPRPPLALQPQT